MACLRRRSEAVRIVDAPDGNGELSERGRTPSAILALAVNSRRLFRGMGHKQVTSGDILSRVTRREHPGGFERKGSCIRLTHR